MLDGEVVLIEDTETVLRAGEAAAWRAGDPVGHCLENRGGGTRSTSWWARAA
jgi:uncharacterized cupin superfamily protein